MLHRVTVTKPLKRLEPLERDETGPVFSFLFECEEPKEQDGRITLPTHENESEHPVPRPIETTDEENVC